MNARIVGCKEGLIMAVNHALLESWFNPKFISPPVTKVQIKKTCILTSLDDDHGRKILQKNRAKDEGKFSYLLWQIENDWKFEYHDSTFDLKKKKAIYLIIEWLKKENLSQSEKYNILNLILNNSYSCQKQISYLISNITNSSLLLEGINLLLETKSSYNYKYITVLLSNINGLLTKEEILDYCKCIANYPYDFQKQFIIDLLNNYSKLHNYVPLLDSVDGNDNYLTLSYFCRSLDKYFLALTDYSRIQYVSDVLYQYINTKKYVIKSRKNTSYLANIKNLITNPNYEVIYLILNNYLFNAYDITSIFSKSYIYDSKPLEMSEGFNRYGMNCIRKEILKIFLSLKEDDDIDIFISLVEDFFSTLTGEKEDLKNNLNFLAKIKEHAKIRKKYVKERSLKIK